MKLLKNKIFNAYMFQHHAVVLLAALGSATHHPQTGAIAVEAY